jgi:hypothetical protein
MATVNFYPFGLWTRVKLGLRWRKEVAAVGRVSPFGRVGIGTLREPIERIGAGRLKQPEM